MAKVYVGIFIGCLLLLMGLPLGGTLWSNFGWVSLNTSIKSTALPVDAARYFGQATRLDPSQMRAWLGRGMAFAALNNEPQATEMWQNGDIDPALLISLGDKQNPNTAFIYFRAADTLHSTQAQFRVGELCQQTLDNPLGKLSVANAQYCVAYFADNNANLMLNGQFEAIPWEGWRGAPLLRDIALDSLEGVPPPSLHFTHGAGGYYYGLYQRLELEPGTRLKFSGYFRMVNVEPMSVRFLYLEWEDDGRTLGNEAQNVPNLINEWFYLERYFTMPSNDHTWLQAYPILFNGQGQVWVDDIRLSIVNDSN